MQYQITVQHKPYKTVESDSVMEVLQQVVAERDAGLIPGYDDNQPAYLSIVKL